MPHPHAAAVPLAAHAFRALAALQDVVTTGVPDGPDGPGATGVVAALAGAAEPWRELYANSIPASTAVLFAHVAGLVVAGGLALAADRGTLRAAAARSLGNRPGVPLGGAPAAAWRETPDDARARQLADLARAHRAVVAALGVVLASGALLALADVEVYVTSPVYWTKMALVAALLANGFLMTRAERAVGGARGVAETETRWGRMRTHALLSVALWFATLLAGTTLGNS